jgi:hypothetical protein
VYLAFSFIGHTLHTNMTYLVLKNFSLLQGNLSSWLWTKTGPLKVLVMSLNIAS